VHGLSALWRQGALSKAAPLADAADLADLADRVLPLLLGPRVDSDQRELTDTA
jgi:hypothetical protein